ncbi:MAG TPA: glycosyltransferase, partial [Ignavibacteriaceae bacterium]|nr:glycosyltransferase [Ignavibacteriaceae bacterium]
MKILIITPRIPYPPYRGDKLKIYNLSKHLSQNNSVKIVTFLRNKEQLEDLENFKKSGIQIETIKLPVWESILKAFLNLFSKIPFQVAWFSSEKMKNKIDEEISKNNYDVIYFHLIRSAQYLNSQKGKSLKVIDFTDAVSLYLNRFAEIEKNPLKKLLIKIEEKRIKHYENIAEKFNCVFICSEIDRDYLLNRGIKANIKIFNNGIDVEYFNSDVIDFEKNRIIFTGNMPYYANYDAAIYFSKEIFPLILEKKPDSKFYIVGQKPSKKIKALASKNIVVTGFVPDIKEEYLKSAVNVAPMRFGAGTLNKVIESIA